MASDDVDQRGWPRQQQERRCCQRRSRCTTRVEPPHFDWRWRERPALALLVWETSSRPSEETTPHPDGVN